MKEKQAERSKNYMAKFYRITTFTRINNAMITWLLRLGIKVWSFSLLTVRGRKSGRPIVTPLAIFVQDQKRYLVAPYGVVNWVRNLRAAGGEATLTRRRHSEKIHAIELEPEAAAPIFRASLRSGPPGIPAPIFRIYRSLKVLPYLNVTEHSSLEEFEREVLTHPVFLLDRASECAAVPCVTKKHDRRSFFRVCMLCFS
jgi:deazaflavin-dependent oxidoreductase (nitroreductase family)